jgi:2-dehydro-3-deoxy-D-arabinonate dehydratase
MKIVRFKSGRSLRLGLLDSDSVVDLTALDERVFKSFASLALSAEKKNVGINELITRALEDSSDRLRRLELKENDRGCSMELVIPVSPPEVWACGVTYKRSQEAREVETQVKGVYDLVYNAVRPEIFFKGTARHCVGPGGDIGIRGDSRWSVPEAELVFVLGSKGAIVGFTAGNDVSSRDIEGENPLYLPQAKTFKGSCALGPAIVTVDEVGLEPKLGIECEVFRAGRSVFKGSTSTSMMKRKIEELRFYLLRYNPLPLGSVCFTVTGIVPPDDFSLEDQDIVEIRVEEIGVLRNRVHRLAG